MSPDQTFQIANLVALAGWVALLASPWAPRLADRVAGLAVPALLAAAYVGLLLARWGRADGGFGSLDEVALLFSDRHVLLAGWIHYLAFDLAVGAWIVRDGRARGLPFWTVLPCLPLTFLFGPAGFLLFVAIRLASGRVRPSPAVP